MREVVAAFLRLTKKQPSREAANPANQLELGTTTFPTKGLATSFVLGKDFFNVSDNPSFSEARILIISCNPSTVRCPHINVEHRLE